MTAIVTFDPSKLLIIEINSGNPAVNELDAVEVYSEWKQWLLDDASRMGNPQAFTPVGGDPRTLTQNLGITYFMENGWRIRPAEYSHKLTVNGNLFTREPGESLFVPTLGAFNVHTETVVSNIIDTITVGGVDQATVQAALTAQGYTTERAPNLDSLDISVSAVAAAVWASVVDGSITGAQSLRLMNAILGGKVSGAGSGNETFRNPADTKDRVVTTVDTNGNRTVVVRDLT